MELAGHECIPIVRRKKADAFRKEDISHRAAVLDMDEYEKLGSHVGRCDCLVCLAWEGTRGRKRLDSRLQELNYKRTMNAIRSAVSYGCRRIVTAGSQAEYGNILGMISEAAAPNPNTAYGKYKLKLYEDASRYCANYGGAVIEPRYFSLYGPGDTEETMVISTASKMMRNAACSLTEGIQKWDFLYIDDAVDALIRLIEHPSAEGVYNFGSGDCRQLRDFILEMREVLGSCSRLDFGAIPYGEAGMVSICPDTRRLERTVGSYARTAFRQGILEVAKDLEKKRDEKNKYCNTLL